MNNRQRPRNFLFLEVTESSVRASTFGDRSERRSLARELKNETDIKVNDDVVRSSSSPTSSPPVTFIYGRSTFFVSTPLAAGSM